MTYQPQGRYRILGEKGHPNLAFLEIGKIAIEVTEQEYRDRGYAPDFDQLPWKINFCAFDEKNSRSHKD